MIDNSKFFFAIITSGLAFALGIINIISSYFNLKAQKKNNLELEKVKSTLMNNDFLFKEEYLEKKESKLDKSKTKEEILSSLQILKDTCYILLSSLNQSDDIYFTSLQKIYNSTLQLIKLYEAYYMKFDNILRNNIHEIKNVILLLNITIDNQLLSKKVKTKMNRITEIEINRLIIRIDDIQSKLLK